MMSGRTCGLNALKVAVYPPGWYFASLQLVWHHGAPVGTPMRLCPAVSAPS